MHQIPRVGDVKRLALLLVIICGLAGTPAFAEQIVSQPLTRADCEKSNLTWNDNANVCDVSVREAEATREPDATAVSTGQPLTN